MTYRMPAEWEKHGATWMAWPCRNDLWPDLNKARRAYAQIVKAIAEFEPVKMVCRTQDLADCQNLVGDVAEVLDWPINDSWTRDSGPIFLFNERNQPVLIDWRFNGWGAKFVPYDDDAQFVHRAAKHLSLPVVTSELTAEGGAIHVDGQGTALTTRQCLLNRNRNPGWSEAQIEHEFKTWLGVEKTLWLDIGLVDDHTDGHIDEIACFIEPGKVLALISNDPDDANFPILQANLKVLQNATDAKGRALEVHTVEQPEARYLSDGTRLSLSYINFYLPNAGVIMPAFDQPEYDQKAKEKLQQLFPNRKIIQIPALDIFEGGGGIHCITQQQPAF